MFTAWALLDAATSLDVSRPSRRSIAHAHDGTRHVEEVVPTASHPYLSPPESYMEV